MFSVSIVFVVEGTCSCQSWWWQSQVLVCHWAHTIFP